MLCTSIQRTNTATLLERGNLMKSLGATTNWRLLPKARFRDLFNAPQMPAIFNAGGKYWKGITVKKSLVSSARKVNEAVARAFVEGFCGESITQFAAHDTALQLAKEALKLVFGPTNRVNNDGQFRAAPRSVPLMLLDNELSLLMEYRVGDYDSRLRFAVLHADTDGTTTYAPEGNCVNSRSTKKCNEKNVRTLFARLGRLGDGGILNT